MLKKLKIVFEWRILSDNGLLEKPRQVGPYYDSFSLSTYSSREEAFNDLTAYFEHGGSEYEAYTLIERFKYKYE